METCLKKISCGVRQEDHPRTWKWFITLDRKSPITGVVGPLPNGLSWLINGGYQLLTNWDDPPSTVATVKRIIAFLGSWISVLNTYFPKD